MTNTNLATILLIISIYLFGFTAKANVIKFLPNLNLPSAGYLTINNKSNEDLEITSVKSEYFKKIEIHKSTTKNNHTSMHPVKTLKIPAKKSIELKPGGIHLMLFEPVDKLEHNKEIKLNFLDKNENVVFHAILRLKNRTKDL